MSFCVCVVDSVPATLVNASESAFPVSEEILVGMLYVCGNALAACLTFIGQELLKLPPDSAGPAMFYPWGIWTTLTLIVGYVPVLIYVGSYRRLTMDLSTKLINSLNEPDEVY